MTSSFSASRFSRHGHLVALASYTLISLVMSAPLAAHFSDSIPGVDGDVWSYLWAMGWARVSLLLGANPFHTDYIFYPLGGATQLLWGTALPSFASLPLQFAFGLVPAFNLVYLAASVLTGFGTYLLALEVLRGATPSFSKSVSDLSPEMPAVSPPALHAACFLAGLIFAFGALRLGYGIAFTNLFHTEFTPFYILLLVRATRKGGGRNILLAGFFLALNVYIDFQIAAFLVLMTAPYCLWVLWRDRKGYAKPRGLSVAVRDANVLHSFWRLLPRWFVMLAFAALLSLPMLVFVVQDFAIEGGNYIRVYPLKYSSDRSYDLFSFFVPNARSSFYQPIAPRVQGVNASVNTPDDSELSPDRQSFIGITVLILVALGIFTYRRALWFWLVVAFVFALLSLGPVLHVAGNATNIPLPYALVNTIPVLNHIRIPMRYGILVFLALAVMGGAGARVLLARRSWLILPLGACVLLEAAIFPYPTLPYTVPPIYDQIARMPGDFTVLDIPSFNWRFAAKNETYQVAHQKRILRAYTNRIAPDLADYFSLRATPIVVKTMRILEGAEPNESINDRVAEDRSALMDTLRFFNLRLALVHLDQLQPDQAAQIGSYLRDVLGASVLYRNDMLIAYQFPAPPAPAPSGTLNLADNANLMYLGRGWQVEPLAKQQGIQARYLRGTTSELYLNQNLPNAVPLTLNALNQDDAVTLSYSMQGQLARPLSLPSGWSAHSLSVDPNPRPFPLLYLGHSDAPQTIAVGSVQLK